ncbi:MAG: cadherin-like domain-containing protein [Flavobacteriaceae bacterium]|nr:cadherin-like domain-containing protein [Flavobacteriaceae bacterium]
MKKLFKLQSLLLVSLFIVSCSSDDPVVEINSIPVAVDMSAISDAGAAVEIELVATDADYDPLTFSVVTQPTMGTVTISGNKATYTPNENADGVDTFTYKANDGVADSNTATATVTVNGSFTLSGTYTTNKTLTADKIWELKGRVFIADGATLTIPAGTIIKAAGGTGTDSSFICIARGGKIDAQGTADKPIIMTSVADDITVGQKYGSNLNDSNVGLWGGLLVLGKAPGSFKNDVVEFQIEGIPSEETNGLYGGNDPADNSGIINYVSIRHGGTSIGEDNEINGLTLGGVGTGTTITNVEVVGNQDDGIEFFGGTVNASNLLVWGHGDDGLDIDQSYAGTINNAVVIANSTSDHGLEIDGPEGSMEDSFKLENITLIGDGTAANGEYADFRQKALGSINNLYAYGFQLGKDFELDAEADSASFEAGTLTFSNIEIILPDGESLTGGEVFDDKSETPNAMYEDAKNLAGETFAKGVTSGTSSVGADQSVFNWTFAKHKNAM